MKNAVYLIIFIFTLSNNAQAEVFSERKNLNKILRGFYKNDILKCTYSNKPWSVGFKSHPYGMVINGSTF